MFRPGHLDKARPLLIIDKWIYTVFYPFLQYLTGILQYTLTNPRIV